MEAPQGVESTGTNRPSDLNTPEPFQGSQSEILALTMRFPGHDREHPHVHPQHVPVVIAVRETPGPIPNPEVKPTSADGTAPETVWESRTPPDNNHTLRAAPTRGG